MFEYMLCTMPAAVGWSLPSCPLRILTHPGPVSTWMPAWCLIHSVAVQPDSEHSLLCCLCLFVCVCVQQAVAGEVPMVPAELQGGAFGRRRKLLSVSAEAHTWEDEGQGASELAAGARPRAAAARKLLQLPEAESTTEGQCKSRYHALVKDWIECETLCRDKQTSGQRDGKTIVSIAPNVYTMPSGERESARQFFFFFGGGGIQLTECALRVGRARGKG
jgi:hypothetical protein